MTHSFIRLTDISKSKIRHFGLIAQWLQQSSFQVLRELQRTNQRNKNVKETIEHLNTNHLLNLTSCTTIRDLSHFPLSHLPALYLLVRRGVGGSNDDYKIMMWHPFLLLCHLIKQQQAGGGGCGGIDSEPAIIKVCFYCICRQNSATPPRLIGL